jgi:endonuclease V-like protein UPF0215 family
VEVYKSKPNIDKWINAMLREHRNETLAKFYLDLKTQHKTKITQVHFASYLGVTPQRFQQMVSKIKIKREKAALDLRE